MDRILFSGNFFHHFENSETGSSGSMSMPEANLFPTQFPHSKFSFQSSNYSFEKKNDFDIERFRAIGEYLINPTPVSADRGNYLLKLIEEIANEVLFGRQLEYTVRIKSKKKPETTGGDRNHHCLNQSATCKAKCRTNKSLLSELLIRSNEKNPRKHDKVPVQTVIVNQNKKCI